MKASLGWLAGYVDRGEDSSVFAMNIDIRSPADLARRHGDQQIDPGRDRSDLVLLAHAAGPRGGGDPAIIMDSES